MKKAATLACGLVVAIAVALAAWVGAPAQEASAVMCFKTGERTSGMNKICYYDCLGSTVAITIRSTELCPLSINQ
jgi:hypothetical protein